jgi:hypothetical protein
MLKNLDPPLRFALPKISADGELLGYYTKFIRDLRCGEYSTAHEARLNGQRACVTVYHSRLVRYFTNPAKYEFEALKRVRVEMFDAIQHLPRPTGWLLDKFSGPLLATELITDVDGQPSKTLAEVASVTPQFSACLGDLLSRIRDRQIPLNVAPTNILVQRTPTGELNPVLAEVGGPAGIIPSFGRTIVTVVLRDRHLRHLAASIMHTLAVTESKVYLPPSAPSSSASDFAALAVPVREPANMQTSDH